MTRGQGRQRERRPWCGALGQQRVDTLPHRPERTALRLHTARAEPCAACGPCALSSGRFGWPALMRKFMPQQRAKALQPAPLPAPHQKLSQSSSAPAATGWASLGGALADLAAEGAAAAAADAFLPVGAGVAVDRRVEVSLTGAPVDAGLPAGAAGTGRCAPVAPPPGCAARAWSAVSLNTATAPTKACA